MTYETKIHSLVVKPVGDPLSSELATVISVGQDMAGPFVTISQGDERKSISVEPADWDAIKIAVQRMFDEWGIV